MPDAHTTSHLQAGKNTYTRTAEKKKVTQVEASYVYNFAFQCKIGIYERFDGCQPFDSRCPWHIYLQRHDGRTRWVFGIPQAQFQKRFVMYSVSQLFQLLFCVLQKSMARIKASSHAKKTWILIMQLTEIMAFFPVPVGPSKKTKWTSGWVCSSLGGGLAFSGSYHQMRMIKVLRW